MDFEKIRLTEENLRLLNILNHIADTLKQKDFKLTCDTFEAEWFKYIEWRKNEKKDRN